MTHMTDVRQRTAREARLLAYLGDMRARLSAIAGRLRADLPAVVAEGGVEVGVGLADALDAACVEPSEGACECLDYACLRLRPSGPPSHMTYWQRQRWLAEPPSPPAETRPLVRYWHSRPERRIWWAVWESTQAGITGPLLARLTAALEEIDAMEIDAEIYLERTGETRDELYDRLVRESHEDDAR